MATVFWCRAFLIFFLILLVSSNTQSDNVEVPECDKATAKNLSAVFMFANSSFIANDGHHHSKTEYFQVEDRETGATFFTGCTCTQKLCLRKCCPFGFWATSNGVCVPQTLGLHHIEPLFYIETIQHNDSKNVPFDVIVGDNCRYGKYALDPENFPGDEHFLQLDGSVFLAENNMVYRDFCLERLNDSYHVQRAFICFEEAVDDNAPFKVYSVGMLVSVPFLLATFLVYALIPELRNLHGRSLMCHVFSLMTAYIFLTTLQLATNISQGLCLTAAFITLFSFLVSFFWLNVMCFDIWWTFSGLRGFRGTVREAEHKKFLIYSAYAWGIPVIILIVAIILQFHPPESADWLSPNFGNEKCWFRYHATTILYLYGPLLLIVACNIVLFTSTALKIMKIKKDTAMLQRDENQRHDNTYEKNKQRFNLYLKLFVVMGINWSMELASFYAGGADQYWLLTDVANTLYGVLIFVIFAFKRQIWKLLVKRYHILMGRPHLANTTFARTQVTAYSISQSSGGPNNSIRDDPAKFSYREKTSTT